MDESIEMQKSFLKYLKKLLSLFSGGNAENIDKTLLEEGDTILEKQLIAEMCEEVDAYHENMKKLKASGKDSDEWLKEEIERFVKEVKPEATPDDIKFVKAAVEKAIDKNIEESFNQYIEEEAIESQENNNDAKVQERKEDIK